ncbi:MAG TPA: 50S ribosomal protein L13, partial [Tissierellaceae bacterium]|nr:50S ribosomal protein L13 [Tissierellaceae bacterium]
MKSYIAKPADVQRKWYIVDAEGKTLGRLATEIATVLRGKHKVTFTPHVDGGDFVVVVNAEKVVLTGKKLDQKVYRSHSGYIGGMKETTARDLLNKNPEQVMLRAVKGMLPHNSLGRQMLKKLRVY